MLPVCLAIRLGATFSHGRAALSVRLSTLVLQASLGAYAAAGTVNVHLGPLMLDPLHGCWTFLWALGCLISAAPGRPVSEACAALGLLCASPGLALTCFIPCLIESRQSIVLRRWKLGLLAPSGCLMAMASAAPTLSALAPVCGLALLPALADLPVLAFALLVPSLMEQQGFLWPVILCALGGGLCLFLPLRHGLSFWPLLPLGLALSARAGGLPDSALTGSEAFILALALSGRDRITALFRTPFPPLAGFLSFWFALHCTSGLAGLSPAWTAGAMILSLAVGLVMVRAWLGSWQDFAIERPAWADRRIVPALTLGLCLSICPGILFGLLHGALLNIAGASFELWRAWPIWSVAGGDGAFWYPALVFMLPALLAPAIMPHIPARLPELPPWPVPSFRPPLTWGMKRALCSQRRLVRMVARRMAQPVSGAPTGRVSASPARFDTALAQQPLVLWLLLLAIALAWLGWAS